MSEADEKIPSAVTCKRRRGSGFRYSSRKVLQHSRVRKEVAKGTFSKLGSERKALSYPVDLLSEIGVVHLGDCSSGLASSLNIGETEVERIEESIEIGDTIAGGLKKVRIIRYIRF